MKITVVDDLPSSTFAECVVDLIARRLAARPRLVLGLATGSTPLPVYDEMARRHAAGKLDLSGVTTFNLDEYVNLARDDEQSYHTFMQRHLFSRVNVAPERVHVPAPPRVDKLAKKNGGKKTDGDDGGGDDDDDDEGPAAVREYCAAYERAIADAGGIDLMLLGIGANGHVGFNEPGSGLRSRTRLVRLTERTIADNARFFSSPADVPTHAVSMGVGTIADCRELVLMATGANKAPAMRAALEGPLSSVCPASIVQWHARAHIFVTRSCAERALSGALAANTVYACVSDNNDSTATKAQQAKPTQQAQQQ